MTTASPTPPERADVEALVALARREHHAGRLAEAAAACRQILALRPDLAEPHNNLGVLHAQQGQFDQAATCFQQAIALKASYFEAHKNLGNVLLGQGKLDEAAARFESAIALKPDYFEAQSSLGKLLLIKGQADQAALRFALALLTRPNLAEAHNNLGEALWRLGKAEEAAARFERAIALRPEYAEAYNNLGILLALTGKHDQAMVRFEQTLALRPDYADAHSNLANVLVPQGKLDKAVAHYRQALSVDPGLAEAELGLAVCFLVRGDFERGWPAYEARLRLPSAQPQPQLPRWQGEPLAGRNLLLLREQGLGDTIHFLRYARVFKARGARVLVAAQPALERLLAGHPDIDELLLTGSGKEMPHCDFYLPLFSAAGALGTDASTIPAEVPYLSADPQLIARWREELSQLEGFKIGIVWQGSPIYSGDRWRSIPLASFAPLARLPGVRLISLQKGFGWEQIRSVDFPVLDLADRLDTEAGPFMDTAAVIGNLDLVVVANTSVAHLAGALGAPVFTALSFAPDWRWLRDREDSPWYPTMRLFRQTSLGQWSDVFERIAQAVAERVSSKDKAR